jgi:hypothetical protein
LHFHYALSFEKLELKGSVTKYFVRHASCKTLTAVHIALQDMVIARESQMSHYHLLYNECTTFVKLPATQKLFLQPYQGLAQAVSSNATANTAPLLGTRPSCTRANLNCMFQLWAIFSHPCAAYEQLKFCVQSLLDGLRKQAKFQVRFRPDQPDHFLVRIKCSITIL